MLKYSIRHIRLDISKRGVLIKKIHTKARKFLALFLASVEFSRLRDYDVTDRRCHHLLVLSTTLRVNYLMGGELKS